MFQAPAERIIIYRAMKIFKVEQNVIIVNICCFVIGHINTYFLGGKNVFSVFNDKNNELDTP